MPSLLQRLATDTSDTGKQIIKDTATGVVEAGKNQAQDIVSEASLGTIGSEGTPEQPEQGPAFPDLTQDPELVRAKQQDEKRRRAKLAELQGNLRDLMLKEKQKRDQAAQREEQIQAQQKAEAQEEKKNPFDFIARVKTRRESEKGRG